MDFDEVADELYAQLPADFIGARTAAVAEAKRTDKGLARRIGELGKPTLAGWAVNLLVREAGDQVTELVELGDLLRRAQDDLDPDQLRALDKQRRQVVRALAKEAARYARRAGHPVSDAVVVQVEETLKAAVADPAAAEVVLAGRLTGALTYNGIGAPGEARTTTGRPPRRPAAPAGAAGAAAEPPPPPVDLDAARAAKADRAARREAEERLREARTALRTARAAVDDAAGEAEQATAAAREAARAATAARKAGEDAQARVVELEAALEQARERAAQAGEETTAADAEVERAEADRAAAEEELQHAEDDRDRAQQLVDELS